MRASAVIAALGSLILLGSAAPLRLDLAESGAADRWVFVSDTARIAGGELVMDGRRARSDAFFAPQVWSDVALRAKFLVEPAAEGVLACGFVARAKDARTFYAVHFDRAQAILYRSTPDDPWIEIKRVSGLEKPAGQWHEGILECAGTTMRVSLNGRLLYEAKDPALSQGRIGFYANQGIAHVKEIDVSGDPRPATEKLLVPAESFIHVCSDAGAGGYEAFPDVTRLADGRLMSVFYAGYDHVSVPNERLPRGGRISFSISQDEGKTWGAARILYDGPGDDRDPSITQLADGRLACAFFTGGRGSWLVESNDGGESWSDARQLFARHYVSSPIREISGGRLILGLYREEGDVATGAVAMSSDGGKTWTDPIEIDNAGKYLDAETDVIERSDGTLFAAQRGGRGAEMHGSVSSDGGRTWSVSKPIGFVGHCPYLHRTVEGIVLLAHRSVAGGGGTGLRFSLDEGTTWSEEVRVDRTIGAYPSMVNLRDGSVLIVYYEEGAGSSIRAKRFRATRAGIEWLPPADESVADCGARLIEVRKIWDQAPHNAFTDLVRHRDRWLCTFREGQGHVSPDGALRVIASEDGRRWESLARIDSKAADLRDPKICIVPDGRLMLTTAGALHPPAEARHQSYVWFSGDGRAWGDAIPVADADFWLWRVTWHEGIAYGIGYATAGPEIARLYRSSDGRRFETLVPTLFDKGYPNETSLVFRKDGSCLCLLRRDGQPSTGLLGIAKLPYTEWTWKDLGVRIGGPRMTELPDGRLVAAVRLYDRPVRTGLCWIDASAGSLTEFLRLPSGGDTSYPGLVWHEGILWVSYYASHEGKTSIYLAKVVLDPRRG